MRFTCVYTQKRKTFDKFVKTNKIKNKYIIDVKKLIQEEDVGDDKIYLKILIFNKIQKAIEKNKDIFYIPDFSETFSIEKLFNIKKMLNDNDFNILLFYDQFNNDSEILKEAFDFLDKFDNSQILRDY